MRGKVDFIMGGSLTQTGSGNGTLNFNGFSVANPGSILDTSNYATGTSGVFGFSSGDRQLPTFLGTGGINSPTG